MNELEKGLYEYCCFGYSLGVCQCGKREAALRQGILKNDHSNPRTTPETR